MACSDGTAPDPPGTLSLSVAATTTAQFGRLAAEPTAAGLATVDGDHSLVLSDVKLIVRRIELARADAVCSSGDDDGEHESEWRRHGDCEELEIGPILVDVPLDGGVERVFAMQLPEGTYRGVELQIHQPSLRNDTDLAFLRDHPLLEGVSIVVEGTYDGKEFTFVQRVEARQRYVLDPPLEITADSEPTNLTLQLDLSTWFLDENGSLVDPVSANRGGVNERLVRTNILRSLDAFKDDDHDGRCDDERHG